MKINIRFAALLAALSAALMVVSLLLPVDNHSKNSESRPGELIAAALSGPAKQGDDIEINAVIEAGKKSGLISRATVINPGKRIIADTEADAIGTFFAESSLITAGDTFDVPGVRGCKLILSSSSRVQNQYTIAGIFGFSAIAVSLISAILLFTLAPEKYAAAHPAAETAECTARLITRILKRSGVSNRYVVLNSAGIIIGSGPGDSPEISGKKLFDSGLKDLILKSAENAENVFDAEGKKFIFY